MPLYSDSNYYYSGGSSQLYSPYYPTSLYQSPTTSTSSAYSPYTSSYSRAYNGTYIVPLTAPRSPTYTTHGFSSRYQPKLTTITETSALSSSGRHTSLLPLTRQSPKILSYSSTPTSSLPKYTPPRPIPINTADIDVSKSHYRRHQEKEAEARRKQREEEAAEEAERKASEEAKRREASSDLNNNANVGDGGAGTSAGVSSNASAESRTTRCTIKRDRPVVRLSTIRSRSKDRDKKSTSSSVDSESAEPKAKIFKDLPEPPEEPLTWRKKLAEDLAAIPKYPLKKSPGDLMRERYLIQEGIKPDEPDVLVIPEVAKVTSDTEEEPIIDQVVVELDPVDCSIRRLSIPQCPTFHDICEDISSDKIDDDLNAGILRRRASLIQEQEQELLNQLQRSTSGTFQLINLERQENRDNLGDDSHRQSTSKRKSKKGKKIRHKITAIVEVENAPLLPILQEKEEDMSTTPTGKEKSKPKFTFNVESIEEHQEIHKVLKLPKRKSIKKLGKPKEVALPEGFMHAKPKMKSPPKANAKKKETFISTAEIFTFDTDMVERSKREAVEERDKPKISKEPKEEAPKVEEHKVEEPKIADSSKMAESSEIPESPEIFHSFDSLSSPKSVQSPKFLEEKVKSPLTLEAKDTKPKVSKLKTTTSLDSFIGKPSGPTHNKTLEKSQSLIEGIKSPTLIEKPKKEPTKITSIPEEKITVRDKPPLRTNEPQKTEKTHLKTSISLDSSIKPAAKTPPQLHNLEKSQSVNVEVATPQPSMAKPKPIQKPIQRSDSGEDFWAQIGSRETLYMTNRKKNLLENQWQKREDLLDAQTSESVKNLDDIKSAVNAQKKKELKKANEHIKTGDKGVEGRSQSMEAASRAEADKAKQIDRSAKEQTKEPQDIKPKTEAKAETETEEKAKADGETKIELSKLTAANVAQAAAATGTGTAKSTIAVSTTADTTKINTGQAAKSPEQDQSKFTAPLASISINVNVKDKTLNASGHTKVQVLAKNAKLAESVLEPKSPKSPKLPKSPPPTTAATSPPAAATTTATSGTTSAAAGVGSRQQEIKIASADNSSSGGKQTEADKKLPIGQKSPPTDAKVPVAVLVPVPVPVPVTKPKTAPIQTSKASPTAASAVKAKQSPTTPTTPINADQFISRAPAKTTTSPIKTKNASPKTTITATISDGNKPKTMAATPTTPIATTVPLPEPEPTRTRTPATKTSETTAATVATTAAVVAAPVALSDNNNMALAQEASKNLSKFATVQNLAQCLQDVDGDLDDYIPSSADDDDYSTDDYSSDGIGDSANLSASMKKKLKQRRRKEKQAEKARFDPQKKVKIDTTNKCYVKDEAPRYPLVATPRPLWKREKIVYSDEDTDDSDSEESGGSTEETDESEECTTSEEYEDELRTSSTSTGDGVASSGNNSSTQSKESSSIIRMSTCSNDSGFEGGTAPSSPKKMLETSYTYSQFQKSGRFTPPATAIPRFKNYTVDDFHFLAVLGKGSFGKVLLAELRDTTYYYAVKCLKKDVVLEDDDVDSTLIERKVLALGTKHPYLCHLFCTFQTESHLFFVMEYLNGGDLMFHIQESGRFTEERARFYGAEIISGLKFLHKKGIIYRDLKLDNVLLDYEGHVRIADFGMCKLQIYLDKTADSFCGTPDYMAPEIVKGEKYNQNVDWWSFGVLLYEMLIGQSPFSGCDEDELFWSICNEIPWFPVYISAEATSILKGLLEKDYTKRIGSQYSPAGDVTDHIFFRPIDWKLLDKRQLEPPFKPQVKHPLDTQYFDRVFTRERVRLTPIDKEILQSMDQKQFLGFTYTNPHITLD